MSERIGRFLERTGQGGFRLLGEVPEGSIDSHAHLGMYLRMPLLGGMNLTAPGTLPENLGFHVAELKKNSGALCEGIKRFSPAALEGLLDVGLTKTEMRGPGSASAHLFTSMDSLFDRESPCYMDLASRPSLALFRDMAAALKAFPRALQEANAANLMSYMDEYGFERAVATPVESGRFSRFSQMAMEICAEYPRAIRFFSVHPRNPHMEDLFTTYRLGGGKGVKFHPEFQGVGPDSEEAMRLFELCSEAKLPVVCHVGGVKQGAAHSHPDRYRQAVARFRELPFILCHVGLADRDATVELARKYDNVWLETSGQPASGIEQAARAIGPQRILFGSDWPLYHPAVPISCVLEAFPKESDLEKVFRDNLKALLGEKKKASKGRKTKRKKAVRTVVRKVKKSPAKAARKSSEGSAAKPAARTKSKSQDRGDKKVRAKTSPKSKTKTPGKSTPKPAPKTTGKVQKKKASKTRKRKARE